MSENKNNINTFENITDSLATAGQNVGIVMMAMATTLGLVEFSTHENKSAVLAAQPVYVVAETNEDPNPVRREREETHPHSASFAATQRSPGRTGKP